MLTSQSLLATLEAIDECNAKDPNIESYSNTPYPKELLYGQRMSERLSTFYPEASEELQIAIRAQHICRWMIARSDFPMDKAGYKAWRTELAKFHGETVAKLMKDNGYLQESCNRVKDLLMKRRLKLDKETQTLEDVACLVFLDFYFEEFASKYSDEKIIDILQKTWNKMSQDGQAAALLGTYSEKSHELITRALG